ncbi:effector-associated domain 2-containing protein [Streptomyces sp. MH13]|uniref:VMAP-C domain-containing protein n=1 Tax=Streptomyces sp. MH13 TaxID=3417651 RepID=UPI003CEE338A
METGAGFGAAEGDSGHARGAALLLELTEALCGLGCTEDPQGRSQFATVLGDHLGLTRPVDLRGVKQREDVVTLVRTALKVEGGEHVLVTVVRILEGTPAGDALDRLITPDPPAPPQVPPGPLVRDDEARARAVLAGGELPAGRLRDDLAEELNGLDLPTGLLPDQLFLHVLAWNAQPDGLPPAVLLLDRAGPLAATRGHRAALCGWVDDWARRAGLTQELIRRRETRARTVRDPDIPRCLVVAVEPARDGSGEVVVRPWLNTVPGHWDPQPGAPAVTTLDALGPAVDDALRQGGRLWAGPGEPPAGGHRQPSAYVEFVLPYELLNHDVASLTYRIGDGRPLPLGLKYGVHLRSLDRMRTDDALVRHQWQERWHALRQHGVSVHGWSEPDAQRIDAWQATLAGDTRHTAVVMDAPARISAMEALKAAIAEGVGLAVWDRRGAFPEERREVVTAVFAAVPTPGQIPLAIHRLRQNAELNRQGPGRLLGRHIGFFWDDPTRIVDMHTIDPGELADEEAPA